MSPELEGQIRARWPKWFGRYTDHTKSLMGHGFRHGDGWYRLLVKTLERIEPEVAVFNVELSKIGERFEILEVEERFGELRIVALPTTADIIFAFLDTRYESLTICELCGAPGELRAAHNRTLCTLCSRQTRVAQPAYQYSSGRRNVVAEQSASVITQTLCPVGST